MWHFHVVKCKNGAKELKSLPFQHDPNDHGSAEKGCHRVNGECAVGNGYLRQDVAYQHQKASQKESSGEYGPVVHGAEEGTSEMGNHHSHEGNRAGKSGDRPGDDGRDGNNNKACALDV